MNMINMNVGGTGAADGDGYGVRGKITFLIYDGFGRDEQLYGTKTLIAFPIPPP